MLEKNTLRVFHHRRIHIGKSSLYYPKQSTLFVRLPAKNSAQFAPPNYFSLSNLTPNDFFFSFVAWHASLVLSSNFVGDKGHDILSHKNTLRNFHHYFSYNFVFLRLV